MKKDMNSKNNDVTNAALRMRRSRQRRSAGCRVLRVEVHIDVIETLIEMDYLAVEEVRDLASVSGAVARFIEDSASAVACNGITLESW